MCLTRNYDGTWAEETLTGPTLTAPLAITQNQFISFRIAGDPAFTNGNFRMIYIYAYDGAGNFGRWGSLVPLSTNWHVVNMKASGIKLPWNSTVLPDFNNLTSFSILVTGQADPPSWVPYDGTIYVDDLQVRDTPLPRAAAPNGVTMLDDFEYPTDVDLQSKWTPDFGTLLLSDNVTYRSTGTKSMESSHYYASTWATVVLSQSQLPAAMTIRPDQYITFRIAGDPQYTDGPGPTRTCMPGTGVATMAAGPPASPRARIGR